jgi:hypothetical protein
MVFCYLHLSSSLQAITCHHDAQQQAAAWGSSIALQHAVRCFTPQYSQWTHIQDTWTEQEGQGD